MPAPSNRIELEVLGQRMILRSDASTEHLQRVVAYVEKKAREMEPAGPVASSKRILLTALNIADDLMRERAEAEAFRRAVVERSRALLAELEGL